MENRLIIHTDGGARGNPGPAAIGVVIEQEPSAVSRQPSDNLKTEDRKLKTVVEFGKTIGETTNNVAEYTAVIEALQYLSNSHVTCSLSHVNFFLDSKLVVEQLNGNYKIKDSKLRELSLQIRMMEQGLGSVITYSYVPREQNKRADLMVNQALNQ